MLVQLVPLSAWLFSRTCTRSAVYRGTVKLVTELCFSIRIQRPLYNRVTLQSWPDRPWIFPQTRHVFMTCSSRKTIPLPIVCLDCQGKKEKKFFDTLRSFGQIATISLQLATYTIAVCWGKVDTLRIFVKCEGETERWTIARGNNIVIREFLFLFPTGASFILYVAIVPALRFLVELFVIFLKCFGNCTIQNSRNIQLYINYVIIVYGVILRVKSSDRYRLF